MATTNPRQLPTYFPYDSDDSDDTASQISEETDDGEDHRPEKIIAEAKAVNGLIWYLVKWENCPVLRSSWEGSDIFHRTPVSHLLLRDWEAEKKRQSEGTSKPLNIEEFDRAVYEVEKAERQRRRLRRLKHKVKRVLLKLTD